MNTVTPGLYTISSDTTGSPTLFFNTSGGIEPFYAETQIISVPAEWQLQQVQNGTWTIQDMNSKKYLGYPAETIANLESYFYGINLDAEPQQVFWDMWPGLAPNLTNCSQLFVHDTLLTMTLLNLDDGEQTVVLSNASNPPIPSQCWTFKQITV